MSRDKLTVGSVRQYLDKNLSEYYPQRELRAIINIVLRYLSGKEQTYLLLNPDHEISSYNWFKVKKICHDLKNMVPVQYITGETEFYGITLKVTGDTLIPRQETEELVDRIIRDTPKSNPTILDICTGSGCIAISLAVNIPEAIIEASDYSAEILEVASLNAKNNNVNINFIEDSIIEPAKHKYGRYEIIVCNPPYITESEKKDISDNVLNYEPHRALFVPDDNPLLFYIAVLELSRNILEENGLIYFEINEKQPDQIKNLLGKYCFRKIEIIEDINGRPRIAKAIKS